MTSFLFFAIAKVAELSIPKLSISISKLSFEESKLVILSTNFFLNLVGAVIAETVLFSLVLPLLSLAFDENPHFFYYLFDVAVAISVSCPNSGPSIFIEIIFVVILVIVAKVVVNSLQRVSSLPG